MKEIKYCGFWRRFFASFFDSIIIFIAVVILMIFIEDISFINRNNYSGLEKMPYTNLFLAIAGLLYLVIYSYFKTQVSLGKTILNIELLPENNKPNIFRILYTKQKALSHDIICKTKIIKHPISNPKYLNAKYCGFWQRFIATSIDLAATMYSAGYIISNFANKYPFYSVSTAFGILRVCFFIWSYSRMCTTISKYLLNIEVISIYDPKLSKSKALLRYIIKLLEIVATIPTSLPIFAFRRENLTLHDIIYGTRVIERHSRSSCAIEVIKNSQITG